MAKRRNNREAGLSEPRGRHQDDPQFHPELTWPGTKGHTSFEVDTVSLYIHQQVSTKAIVEAIQAKLLADRRLPLDQRGEFSQHDVDQANRLIVGDSLIVLNFLLERERMTGKVQMIYVDLPHGIAYPSNQPRVHHRNVKDGKDEDLGVHSSLAYFRDRVVLCRELLHESGSIFVQISDEYLQRVRNVMDEVFGADNCRAIVTFKKTSGQTRELLPSVGDYLLWYSKDISHVKDRQLLGEREVGGEGGTAYALHLQTPLARPARWPSRPCCRARSRIDIEDHAPDPSATSFKTRSISA